MQYKFPLFRRLTGFSLIELMIVISIVGILASIALPAYHQHMVKARLVNSYQVLLTYAKPAKEQYNEGGGSFNNVSVGGNLSGTYLDNVGANTAGSGGTQLQLIGHISDPSYPEINGKYIYVILTGQGSGVNSTIQTCCGIKSLNYGTNNSPSINLLPPGCNNNCPFTE